MTGERGPIVDVVSLPIAMVISGFLALACYNSIEIFFFILQTFRRRRGLYFWSVLVANLGIPLNAIPAILRLFGLAPSTPMAVLICLGWWMMVTGQSVVLFSRLHLVVGDPRKLRWVLVMIAAVFLSLQFPTSVLFIGSNRATALHSPDPFIRTFNAFEKVQLAAFAVQEAMISGLYVYEANNALKPMRVIKETDVRNMSRQLVGLFVLVVVLDVTILATEYTGHFQIQETYKPVVYSIKLKVEMLVLNNLITLVQSRTCCCRNSSANRGSSTRSRKVDMLGKGAVQWPTQPGGSALSSRGSVAGEGGLYSAGIYDGRDPVLMRIASANH